MKDYNEYENIEDFIFDPYIIQLSENKDDKETINLFTKFPKKTELINNAIFLLRNLKVKEEDISSLQVEKELSILMHTIYKRKRQKITLWTSSIAAGIAILFAITYSIIPNRNYEKERLISILDTVNINTDDVQIISGTSETNVKNNESIKQTEHGDIIVGENEKIATSEIPTEYIQIKVPNGKQSSIKFSDGTIAWINSGSILMYPKIFSEKSREIYIDGEIYLEVAKEKARPFYVHTKKLDVSVLGTKFNINAYSSEIENSVILVEGKVEVALDKEKRTLLPNQGFFSENKTIIVKNVDVDSYICWKEGRMKFNDETLDIILKKISRHYKVEIKFDKQTGNERYKGKLDLNSAIEDVLYNISLSTGLIYSREEDTIYIK